MCHKNYWAVWVGLITLIIVIYIWNCFSYPVHILYMLQKFGSMLMQFHKGDFEKFIRNFRTIADSEVSPRWEFGQLRLGWLNWAVRVFQPKVIESRGGMFRRLFYEGRYHQTRQFVREFGTPLLFIFATLSLILSAMQVVLEARPNNSWPGFVSVSVWFSIAVIIILSAIFFFILLVIVVVLIIQLGFAFRARRRQITERVA